MKTPAIRSGDTPTSTNPSIPTFACFGDGCDSVEPWPVHHIRHRNNLFLRLCTSCVLKHHPGSFCCSCFEVLDSHDRPPLSHCSKCPSVIHLSCLPLQSSPHLFLCPACDSSSPTSFSYFTFSNNSDHRIIDLRAAKVLLAASRLSAASMARAAAIALSEAEKKVKEASFARKRAREMLERSMVVAEKVNLKKDDSGLAKLDESGPKKKVQKKVGEREREKWRRFSEPIGLSGVVVDEKMKSGALESDVKDEEKKQKAIVSVAQSGEQVK